LQPLHCSSTVFVLTNPLKIVLSNRKYILVELCFSINKGATDY